MPPVASIGQRRLCEDMGLDGQVAGNADIGRACDNLVDLQVALGHDLPSIKLSKFKVDPASTNDKAVVGITL